MLRRPIPNPYLWLLWAVLWLVAAWFILMVAATLAPQPVLATIEPVKDVLIALRQQIEQLF